MNLPKIPFLNDDSKPPMELSEAIEILKHEGFGNVYVQEDGPHKFYPEHTHETKVAHVILEGQMALTSEGETHTLKEGDRFDVPANAVHFAKIGPKGCRYLVGE